MCDNVWIFLGDCEHFSDEDIPPGNSFQLEPTIRLSKEMQTIIKNHESFLFKPYGPLHEYISDCFKANLPAAFLHSYLLDNQTDKRALIDLCHAYNETAPITLVLGFTNKMYDLKNDPQASGDSVELLSKEEPTIANLLIDYFHLHKSRKDIIFSQITTLIIQTHIVFTYISYSLRFLICRRNSSSVLPNLIR